MRRLLLWALAQMFGPELVYPSAASESIMAAIHHYRTEEENHEQAA